MSNEINYTTQQLNDIYGVTIDSKTGYSEQQLNDIYNSKPVNPSTKSTNKLDGMTGEQLIAHFGKVNLAIYHCLDKGMSVARTADYLNKRYQHVRNEMINRKRK